MAVKKKIEEEIKEPEFVEVELIRPFVNPTVQSTHMVCTRLGNVLFVEGKAVVTKEMAEELKKLEVIK